MTFSANTDVGTTLSATAHLIPQINVGLNTLDNTTSANVTLNFDASLGIQGNVSSSKKLCLTGNAETNVEVGSQGSFFGIFSNNTGQSLFDKNFTLFEVRAHSLLSTFFPTIYYPFYTITEMLRREFGFVEFEFVESGYAVGSTHLLAICVSRICFPSFARSPTLYIVAYVFSPPLRPISCTMHAQELSSCSFARWSEASHRRNSPGALYWVRCQYTSCYDYIFAVATEG